jgi:hypothetical protein
MTRLVEIAMRPYWIFCSLILAAISLASCGAQPEVSAAPPMAIRIPFELYGVPGPWWRENATQSDFDRDMWTCRTESKRARSAATPETRKDIAYRAFLDCMTGMAWTRGYPESKATG